jgi:hypothetical protein
MTRMSREYNNFQAWRQRVKLRLVEAFGGRCGLCGYDRCIRNLVFHHLDPSAKDFAITSKRIPGWANLIVEVRKCVMLCANCHGEVHHGVTPIPETCRRFDERFATYEGWSVNSNKKKQRPPCRHCREPMQNRFNKKYCSRKCFGLAHRGPLKAKVRSNLTADDITMLLAEHGNRWTLAAESIGISDNGLRKLAATRGLPTTRLPKRGLVPRP